MRRTYIAAAVVLIAATLATVGVGTSTAQAPYTPLQNTYLGCDENYEPCLPMFADGSNDILDYDCLREGKSGPLYVGEVALVGPDDQFNLEPYSGCAGEREQPQFSTAVGCHPGYDPCLPQFTLADGSFADWDCLDPPGNRQPNGPMLTGEVTVTATDDPLNLDRDGDGVACEGQLHLWPLPWPPATVCAWNYTPCLPLIASTETEGGYLDYDCWADGDGPLFAPEVTVDGEDWMNLDVDGDGVGCEGVEYDPANPPSLAQPDAVDPDTADGCLVNYDPCLPVWGDGPFEDYDCAGSGYDGPHFAGEVEITWSDANGGFLEDTFGLDPDGDGVACEGAEWPVFVPPADDPDDDDPEDDDPDPVDDPWAWICDATSICDLSLPDVDIDIPQVDDDGDHGLACDGLGNCRPPSYCTVDCDAPVGALNAGAGPKFTG